MMTPAERLAAQREILDAHVWEEPEDALIPIPMTLHALIAIGELLVAINDRQARQEAAAIAAAGAS
ncbi:hypothetical protein SEA_SHAOBING_2 [Mycobacterium phage Shaobing]|nr:hypothetical protein SEA_SHAOBING_2 [Mycobacterium phage Shaobing]